MDHDAELGARIRAYRERAGLKGQELAAAIGVDPSAVSNIERGKRSVKTAELASIAETLGVSPLALLDDHVLPARMPLAARSDSGAIANGAAYRRLVSLAELHEVLQEGGLTTHPRLADVPDTSEMPWSHASSTLANWALGRLDLSAETTDRFSLLVSAIEESLGVDVLVEPYPGDALTGATIADPSFPLLFVNSDHPTSRSLFTLAHELGHLLAGHGEPISLDAGLDNANDDEKLANAFAAALLMPEDRVREVIEKHGRGPAGLAYLIYHFGVSLEAVTVRLHALREVNTAGRDRLQGIGWRGLMQALDRPGVSEQVAPDVKQVLATRRASWPERRSPRWLLERTRAGHDQGVVSVRPLAGLMGEDPMTLVDEIAADPTEVWLDQGENAGRTDAANSEF